MLNRLLVKLKLAKIGNFVRVHKILSTVIVVAVFGIGYYGYKKLTSTSGETRYVLASVAKGTIVVSVSASGQVSASNQIDIKPKASGDIVSLAVANGQSVRSGQLILQLDARDASKAVRDAEANLESAKISLQKLKQPADALSLIQAENALTQAQESKTKAEDDLNKTYDDAFGSVSNAFADLPTVVTGLQDVLYSTSISPATGNWNIAFYGNAVVSFDPKAQIYRDDADAKYQQARKEYDKNSQDYKLVSRLSDSATIESMLNETYNTAKTVAEAVKSASNLIRVYQDQVTTRGQKPLAAADAHLSTLNDYTSKLNSHLNDLLTVKNSIQSDRDTITSSERTIAEKTESLAKLKSGADPLDLQSQELAVKQRENALLDAKEKLADYYVRAPFDGTIAKVSVNKADSVSNGTVVATLITKQKLAEISLNEVDVAKIKVGNKATLTFDAIDGLSISGEVADIDTVGTVSQGVVTYNLKIKFDTQDDRVKPGMSVSAAIVTDVKPDVLTVPNNAVKSQGNVYYVEMFNQAMLQDNTNQGVISVTAPRQQPVETGLSNDTLTEITSGLKEGDQIVARTITPTASATQQVPSLFGTGNRGGGGAVRIPGR